MWSRFRAVARRPAAPAAFDRDLDRLITLQAVVDRGCALQRRAESFLLACSLPDEPGPAVAREGGAIAREFHRLHDWSIDVAGRSTDPESVDQRVSALLMYHCVLVHDAVRLAFPRFRTHAPSSAAARWRTSAIRRAGCARPASSSRPPSPTDRPPDTRSSPSKPGRAADPPGPAAVLASMNA